MICTFCFLRFQYLFAVWTFFTAPFFAPYGKEEPAHELFDF